jgi:hypothetical protein
MKVEIESGPLLLKCCVRRCGGAKDSDIVDVSETYVVSFEVGRRVWHDVECRYIRRIGMGRIGSQLIVYAAKAALSVDAKRCVCAPTNNAVMKKIAMFDGNGVWLPQRSERFTAKVKPGVTAVPP